MAFNPSAKQLAEIAAGKYDDLVVAETYQYGQGEVLDISVHKLPYANLLISGTVRVGTGTDPHDFRLMGRDRSFSREPKHGEQHYVCGIPERHTAVIVDYLKPVLVRKFDAFKKQLTLQRHEFLRNVVDRAENELESAALHVTRATKDLEAARQNLQRFEEEHDAIKSARHVAR